KDRHIAAPVSTDISMMGAIAKLIRTLKFFLSSSTPGIGHSFSFAKAIADSQSGRPASLSPAVQVVSRLVRDRFPDLAIEQIADPGVDHKFSILYFLSDSQVYRRRSANFRLNGFVARLIFPRNFNVKTGRQTEF